MKKSNAIIQTTPSDNVAIVTHFEGLVKGTLLYENMEVLEPIPMGHKVALRSIPKEDPIIRYGEIIGYANVDIKAGEWVTQTKMMLPEPPNLDHIRYQKKDLQPLQPLEGYAFEGYKNADGSTGTKNVLALSTSVQCVAGMAEYMERKIREELLPKYPNVDEVVALKHHYGCGVAIDAPAAIIPIQTLHNIAQNPNFGGEVLVIGLGCEKLRPERLLPDLQADHQSKEGSVLYLQQEDLYGFEQMVAAIMQKAERHLKKLNARKRETCPASDLVVGLQCGGSDAFSGLTGNPVAGFTADLLVRAGGTVLFSEVTEVRDAVHLLVNRAVDETVAQALVAEMKWYDEYLQKGGADRSANPSPGNKRGGLSTIVEKALGSVVKSGTTPIVDVIGPGAKIRKRGLNFVATPASDFVCGTLQLAAGMNLHVFITGRGTPYGLPMVPVIKMSSNSKLGNRWFDLIDLDAGPIALGKKSIEDMGWELFHLLLDVASGRKQVASDRLGLYNDLVLFNPGPLT